MKRVSVPFLIGAMLFTVIGLYGCASDGERVAPVDASIGVIETRGTDETSRIVFYDGELNEVTQLPLRYANLGDVFHDPLVYQGSLFVIPQGKSKVRDGEAVLQVDVASLASKTHAIGRSAMNDVAVNDEYVFTCDSSYINRCRIDNGDVSKIAIEGVYVPKIVWYEGSLYVFALSLDDNSSMIYCYDEDLALKESIDCSTYNSDAYRVVLHEGKIYFCSVGLLGKQIGVLDTKDNTLSSIPLSKGGPSSVAIADGKLYVAHYNVVQGQDDSALSIVDLETGAIEEHAFEHEAMQMVVTEGSIYVLGDWAIYQYDAESVELIGSKPIENMPGSYSYLSGLFSVK
ncbi:hypothetical protein H8S61_15180 [Eggerthella sp. NSJ-70]|uniref:YncE family protein n=1 Tax=Eggerthella hominis TaxID=2763043 RepID=A0ABR7BVB6_9ACTN|nr:hypothetical protein [Eggerthella hominis]MBC5585530.1 hypothetical protein [Eggerthella hominis]